MKTNLITFLALGLFMFGCTSTPSKKSSVQQEATKNEKHQHGSETETLILNKGEKWKVDVKMMVIIQDMEQVIKSFSMDDQKDYQSLANGLQKNVNLLTSNCTMTGMAHDELHKWLVPYITNVNVLSEAKNEAEAGKAFVNIQESFNTFNQYFK